MTFKPTYQHTLFLFQTHFVSCPKCGSFILGQSEPCSKGIDIIGSLRLEYSGLRGTIPIRKS